MRLISRPAGRTVMLASFALFFIASLVPSVLRPNARLSLSCYHCHHWQSVAQCRTAQGSVRRTLRQWQRQMTSSTIRRNRRTVPIIKMKRSEIAKVVTAWPRIRGSIPFRDKRCLIHCVAKDRVANASFCPVLTGSVCPDALAFVWKWPRTLV